MKAWAQRPHEEAYLLNPAFCATVITASALAYSSVETVGMPFPLAFMILPTVLHKLTRESLPRDTRTSLAAWLQENGMAKILFADRVISLKPFTREAVVFGAQHSWLAIQANGHLIALMKPRKMDLMVRKLDSEPRESVTRARFVGKWFALAGTAQTVMALWGIRP